MTARAGVEVSVDVGPMVDAHQHVWDPARADYSWLTPGLTVLNRVYDQSDVDAELRAAGIDQTVLVQAADNVADTENMFRVARTDPRIAGVVAWVPLHNAGAAEKLLDAWADRAAGQADRAGLADHSGSSDPPVVGVRHLIHREPDPDWMLRAEVQPGLALLAERGLVFDVCAESPELLARVPALAAAHPTLRLVIDHLGKPPIRARGWQPWAGLLADAAAVPTVTAKLSGLNTAAEAGWSSASFQRYVDHALAVFGPERLMYGGDWPFALLAAASYEQIHAGLLQTLGALNPVQRAAVLGATAQRVYRLKTISSE